MSSRDAILASIRANLPKAERPLPSVPKFEENPPADLIGAFGKSLARMGGQIVDPGSSARSAGFGPRHARTQPSGLFGDTGDPGYT